MIEGIFSPGVRFHAGHCKLFWKGESHDFGNKRVVGILQELIHAERVFAIDLPRYFLQLSLKVI